MEAEVCRYARSKGFLVLKVTPMGERGWPDRLFLRNSRVLFIEFKARGRVLSPLQLQRFRQLREYGLPVVQINKASQGIDVINSMI